jgi:DNA segregation ATPase FtsK/SpoIIIE-like protein
MTQNKRRKNKTRAQMATTGTNYVRAARAAGSKALKDPARLSWSPGTIAGTEQRVKVIDSPLHTDLPHLIITGMSAAEPEAMLVDMMTQLIAANTPEDVQFRIIEPTIPLVAHRHAPHVSHYMDSWIPNKEFMPNAITMMEGLVSEMDRRHALMINHTQQPVYNLGKAREAAIRESNQNGTPLEDHPLWMPHIFVVINESSALFADSASKEEKAERNQFVVATAEIARKSRSAGIYLVMSTKFSMTIPTIIKNHMRTIALPVSSEILSYAAIGDSSLCGLPITKGIIVDVNGVSNQEFDRNPRL